MAPLDALLRAELVWFRDHMLNDILPHWLVGVPTESGLFLPHLDREWRRMPGSFGTLVSQSRLLFNFAIGYRETGEQAYADAVERGAEFLVSIMRDTQYGGWFWSCDAEGATIDDSKDAYGHAFVVFGLAHAAALLGSDTYARAAVDAWEVLQGPLSDSHGGLIPRTTRDFSERPDATRPVNTQNPMMHLFEALLALAEVPGLAHMRAAADEIAGFLLARYLPAGCLLELYTTTWTPLPFAEGGRIDLGHQFEWAFLLSTADRRQPSERYLSAANGLLEYAMRLGYDAEAGGIFANASAEDTVIDRSKGVWQQCEAMRTMMHFAAERGRDDLWEACRRTLAFSQRELIDPEFGGWYAGPSLTKGNEWKLDYHVVGVCTEAIRLLAANLSPERERRTVRTAFPLEAPPCPPLAASSSASRSLCLPTAPTRNRSRRSRAASTGPGSARRRWPRR